MTFSANRRWVACDDPECNVVVRCRDWAWLMDYLEFQGWQLGVKINGQRARVHRKDYCPRHRRGC